MLTHLGIMSLCLQIYLLLFELNEAKIGNYTL